MPVYLFKCTKCSKEFERLVSMLWYDRDSVKCPDCGEDVVKIPAVPAKPIVKPWH